MTMMNWRVITTVDLRLDIIYNHFGKDRQLVKMREETQELLDALDGFIQGTDTAKHVAEELGDVELVAQQLINHDVINMATMIRSKTHKVNRTMRRIKSGYYEKERP